MAGYKQYGGISYESTASQDQGQPITPTRQTYSSTAQTPLYNVLEGPDFLARVASVRSHIELLSSNISQIATLHQRSLSSTDSGSSAALESTVTETRILTTQIRDQIRYLETDAARSGGNSTKDSQLRSLKSQFRDRLEQYEHEEFSYKERYQDQIARQYRIVNPGADEDEVQEAMTADWGDEGIFQTAVSLSFAISCLSAAQVRSATHAA